MNFPGEKRIVISSAKAVAEALEEACQRHMIATVPGYCAERWAEVFVNKKTGQGAFYTDARVESALAKTILDARVEVILEKDWAPVFKEAVIVELVKDPSPDSGFQKM